MQCIGKDEVERRCRRPRYSLCTFLIFLTLVCAYLAAWQATKSYVATQPEKVLYEFSTPLPFIICEDNGKLGSSPISYRRSYHIWFFGITCRIPVETHWYELREE